MNCYYNENQEDNKTNKHEGIGIIRMYLYTIASFRFQSGFFFGGSSQDRKHARNHGKKENSDQPKEMYGVQCALAPYFVI